MSGLVPQNVAVRLGKRDGKTSDLLTTPGTLTRAENVVMDQTGELRRRPGGTANGSAANGSCFLFDLNGKLGALDPTAAANLRFTTAVSQVSDINDQRSHDFVRVGVGGGSYDWHVWEREDRSVVVAVFDATTRILVGGPVVVAANATRPSIYSGSGNIIVVYVTQTVSGTNEILPGSLVAQKANANLPTAPAFSGTTTIDTFATLGLNAISGADINGLTCVYDGVSRGGGVIGLIYKTNGTAGTTIRVRLTEISCTTLATLNTSNTTNITCTTNGDMGDSIYGFLQHDYSDSTYHFCTAASVSLVSRDCVWKHSIAINTSGTISSAAIIQSSNPYGVPGEAFRNVTGYMSGTTAFIVAEDRLVGSHTGREKLLRYYSRTSGGTVTDLGTIQGFGIASRPYLVSGGQRMIVLSLQWPEAPTYLLWDLTNVMSRGRVFAGSAGVVDNDAADVSTDAVLYRPQRDARLPYPTMTGDIAAIALYRIGANSLTTAPKREAYLVTFSPSDYTAPHTNLSDEITWFGGIPQSFDGLNLRPAGFNHPAFIMSAAEAGGGALPNATTYQYSAIFAYRTVNGRLARSAPAPVVSATTTAANHLVTLTLQPHRGTPPGNAEYALIFRSLGNPGTNAPLYYYDSVINSTNAATLTYVDKGQNGTGGAGQSLGEALYTQNGAVLENAPMPNASFGWIWGGRQWYILEEQTNAFGFTRPISSGIALGFNEDWIGEIDDRFGRLFCGAGLGERNLLFKENAVYWLAGDGPGEDGRGAFSEPVHIDGAPGCKNIQSIVAETPVGTFYQAPDLGIWLMKYDLSSVFIGRAVFDVTKAQNPISRAFYEPTLQHVRFFQVSTGTTCVYDIQNDQWFTYTGQQTRSVVLSNGRQNYLIPGGGFAIVRESTLAEAIWQENGVAYEALIELAWLSLGDLSGYMRVWSLAALGKLLGAHTLSLAFTADYGTAQTTRSVNSTALQTAHGYRIEARVPMQMQQNTALRLLLRDGSPNTAGFALAALTLNCGFAPGRRPKLPAAHSMG